MIQAIKDKKQDVIERLIARGASVHTKGRYGWTPLHVAVFYHDQVISAGYDNKMMIDVLLAQGSLIDAKDDDGVRHAREHI